MRTVLSLRVASLAACLGAAMAAQAIEFDAWDNFAAPPTEFSTDAAFTQSIRPAVGYQFYARSSGTVSGLRAAISDFGARTNFTLKLYADSGSNTLGSLLGTYSGTTLNAYNAPSPSAVTIPVTGPDVVLDRLSYYWIVVQAPTNIAWNSAVKQTLPTFRGNSPSGFPNIYQTEQAGAFSVRVYQAVPEPSTVAALGLGAFAVLRRRRSV